MWVLITLVVIILVSSAYGKFSGSEAQRLNAANWGFPYWLMYPIALYELAISLLFLVGKRNYGSVGLGLMMIVAAGVHLLNNEALYMIGNAVIILFAAGIYFIDRKLKQNGVEDPTSELAPKLEMRGVTPVIPVDDIEKAIDFYTDKLGFENTYDSSEYQQGPLDYVVLRRGEACLHFQLFDSLNGITMPMLKFPVKNIEVLFQELSEKKVTKEGKSVEKTLWNTKEFAFYDPFMTGITFYESVRQ